MVKFYKCLEPQDRICPNCKDDKGEPMNEGEPLPRTHLLISGFLSSVMSGQGRSCCLVEYAEGWCGFPGFSGFSVMCPDCGCEAGIDPQPMPDMAVLEWRKWQVENKVAA